MKLDVPIEDILKQKGRKVYAIDAKAKVYEALVRMAEKEIGALVVMDDGRLVGIFSERDYARKVILTGRSSKELAVEEIMSKPVKTVEPKTTVDECMQYMTNKRCRHLPVVEGGEVVAMVSIGDLVNCIISAQSRTIHDLEDYISGEYPL